ncbi:unnamed protein product [Linum tenue]|uniref:Uncharacterized protein n=1 Tax=Linum tenue TaxID=586396 RepID=A0AAV0I120_9ROSI|nr:unnamed protein product [Linum tenue]
MGTLINRFDEHHFPMRCPFHKSRSLFVSGGTLSFLVPNSTFESYLFVR